MTPRDALSVLDQATDPRKIGQLTRGDFVAVNQALIVISAFITKYESFEKAEAPAKEVASA